jgi:hypothetical protein
MNAVIGFWENLGNQYTSALISFLTGFMIGQAGFSGAKSIILGLVVGIMFAVVSMLFSAFLDTVFPQSFTVTVNIKSFFTIMLIIIFFIVVASSPNFTKMVATLGNEISKIKN